MDEMTDQELEALVEKVGCLIRRGIILDENTDKTACTIVASVIAVENEACARVADDAINDNENGAMVRPNTIAKCIRSRLKQGIGG